MLLQYFGIRLFFLTIPKPLKQYTLFKKDDPFRSPLRTVESTFRRDQMRRWKLIITCYVCLRGVLFRVTILAKWLRHFNNLTVGETAAPACISRENAEGAGMPPLLSY